MNVTYCTQKGWRTLQQNCRHPPTEATLTYHPNPPPKACLRRRRLTPCLRRRVYGAARRYRRDSPANNNLNHARRTCDAFERPPSIVVVQGRHTTQPRRSTINPAAAVLARREWVRAAMRQRGRADARTRARGRKAAIGLVQKFGNGSEDPR